MEPIRKWRNESLGALRTSFPLTKEQQEDWYRNEICNRNSRTRFWAIEEEVPIPYQGLCGYGGIENIQWENRIGEISLLVAPEARGHRIGIVYSEEILKQAFDFLNLNTVYAECFMSNPAIKFWDKVFEGGYNTILPKRKYWNGEYYDSMYYSMTKDQS
jgi:RimJ/RimL family protein N-acetyltransferase